MGQASRSPTPPLVPQTVAPGSAVVGTQSGMSLPAPASFHVQSEKFTRFADGTPTARNRRRRSATAGSFGMHGADVPGGASTPVAGAWDPDSSSTCFAPPPNVPTEYPCLLGQLANAPQTASSWRSMSSTAEAGSAHLADVVTNWRWKASDDSASSSGARAVNASCDDIVGSAFQCLAVPLDGGWFPAPLFLGLVARPTQMQVDRSADAFRDAEDAADDSAAENTYCVGGHPGHWLSRIATRLRRFRGRRTAAVTSNRESDVACHLEREMLRVARAASGHDLRAAWGAVVGMHGETCEAP